MSRVLGDGWALPGLDAVSRPFFTNDRLTLQQCTACAHIQHPPEDICTACQSFELGSFTSKGNGRIESVTIVHQAAHPALRDRVPYAIVAVSVDDVPEILIIGNVVGSAPEQIRIGDRARVVMEKAIDPQTGEALSIPQWEIVA